MMNLMIQRMAVGIFALIVGLLASGVAHSADPVPKESAFTPTGYVSISATTSSASAVLPTHGLSTPQATTVVVQNLGSNVAYVALAATPASAVVSTTTGYPVQAGGVVRLTIRNGRYAAAITGTSTATVHFSTGY